MTTSLVVQRTGASPQLMGVVNVTPDSFSDGGEHFSSDLAIAHGMLLAEQGATWVDVGGESTRPGAVRVEEQEELRRVVPVVKELAAVGINVSVDTTRASVAQSAVEVGARLINDVSGGLSDPNIMKVVADTGVPYVVMHWRGPSDSMDDHAMYHNVIAQVRAELRARVDDVLHAGARPEQIVLDPGFGFSKNADHNWQLLHGLPDITALGFPVLVGTSRKRFLGAVLPDKHGNPVPAPERDEATAAATALVAAMGAWGIRVHNVPASQAALAVGDAYRRSGQTTVTASAGSHIIELSGLRATGFHGVFDHERRDGQEFVVDLRLTIAAERSVHTDDLSDTVDYGQLAHDVHDEITGEPVDLLEKLAARIADRVMRHNLVEEVEVRLHKPSAPIPVAFDDVVVTRTQRCLAARGGLS